MMYGILLLLCCAASLILVPPAQAYIGPGAGFAFLSSFLVLAASFLLAIVSLLLWPFRLLIRTLVQRKINVRAQAERVIVVGLDGLDPGLAQQFMAAGKMPNFQRLQEMGGWAPLSTSYPSISPAAWSSFMTGVDPASHSIFDFLTRDPCTYAPILSSTQIGQASRVLPLGKYLLPLNKPQVKLLRKGKPFWHILGENRIFSSILRVPITFPPEKFNGTLLSGMCTPDLKGSQGTFSFYTTNPKDKRGRNGGVQFQVTREGNIIHTVLDGPENSLIKDGGSMQLPMTVTLDLEQNRAQVRVAGQSFSLEPRTYSPWIRVAFRPGLGMKVHGICRFYLNAMEPDFELYVSPIHIDPEKPALPVSSPFVYSVYLAKLLGPFGTLGLAEDTWALNEGVLDEDAFLEQAYLFCEERERMFFSALEKTRKGLCVCVFDTSDRIQHMFFRCLDKTHPANKGKETTKYASVIEDLYQRMDGIVGRVLSQIDDKTVLIVMSDHGFTQFRRGVNLNTWLFQNGYMVLKDGHTKSGDWFAEVDWERTRAFSLGLTGLFINRKGREACGIVEEGLEHDQLKQEIIEKLTSLRDDEGGVLAIRGVLDTATLVGPYVDDAPDLLIGYNAGYRNSWDCATGRVTEAIFEDNTKHWSGDHCVDPKLVPGVFFSNRKINTTAPDIKDLAPTVLKLFGVDIPSYMKGKSLMDSETQIHDDSLVVPRPLESEQNVKQAKVA